MTFKRYLASAALVLTSVFLVSVNIFSVVRTTRSIADAEYIVAIGMDLLASLCFDNGKRKFIAKAFSSHLSHSYLGVIRFG